MHYFSIDFALNKPSRKFIDLLVAPPPAVRRSPSRTKSWRIILLEV
jgi:hypothetical protein